MSKQLTFIMLELIKKNGKVWVRKSIFHIWIIKPIDFIEKWFRVKEKIMKRIIMSCIALLMLSACTFDILMSPKDSSYVKDKKGNIMTDCNGGGLKTGLKIWKTFGKTIISLMVHWIIDVRMVSLICLKIHHSQIRKSE